MCCVLNESETTEIYTYVHTLSLHDALPMTVTAAPPVPRQVVSVNAPDGAEVRFDGKVAGQGSFRSEDIRAGSHTVSATIASVNGCPTATDDVTVDRKSTRLNSSH